MASTQSTPLLVTTLGDGAMATVCSQILAGKRASAEGSATSPGRPAPIQVRMWGRDAARLAEINATHENRRYLPGTRLSEAITCESDPSRALANAELLVCAIPTQYMREALTRVKPHVPPGIPVVSVAKGIEIATLHRPSEIIRDVLGSRPIAALSGPSIAAELARMLPATMVVAAAEKSPWPAAAVSPAARADFAMAVQVLFTTAYLRVYRNDDLLGVELAGAMKNVIAIAAGILDGMRAGNNAKAALLTRGLVEITRLGVALGARADTFAGLAGMGDLVTTCVSPEGRNRSFGERVGRGEKPQDVLASMPGVVEGVPTCESMVRLAREKQVATPICEGLHAVLFEGRDPRRELADLMSRSLKSE